MTAVWITLRIVLFLAIVVPSLVWFARRVREVQGIPSDREVDGTVNRHIGIDRNQHGGGTGLGMGGG